MIFDQDMAASSNARQKRHSRIISKNIPVTSFLPCVWKTCHKLVKYHPILEIQRSNCLFFSANSNMTVLTQAFSLIFGYMLGLFFKNMITRNNWCQGKVAGLTVSRSSCSAQVDTIISKMLQQQGYTQLDLLINSYQDWRKSNFISSNHLKKLALKKMNQKESVILTFPLN